MRLPVHALVLTLLGLACTPALAQSSSLTVPKAGKVEIKHGSVRFRPELYEQARPGMIWRMGSNAATTVETAAALVWANGVVFPGKYDLNARMNDAASWDLIFHRDGRRWQRQTSFGELALKREEMKDKRRHTDALQIAFENTRDKKLRKQGGIEFHLRFGPHDAHAPLWALGTGKMKGKIEKTGVQLEVVKLPQAPEFEKLFAADGDTKMPLAKLTFRGNTEGIRLQVEAGEEPVLRFLETGRQVKGTRKAVSSAAKSLKPTLKSSTLTLKLGKTELAFPLTANLLTKAETGGSTGGR